MTQFFGTMFQMGSAPVIEETMKWAEARHRLILSNIANADTPGYRRQDLDSERFARELGYAIRSRSRNKTGDFAMSDNFRTPVSTRGSVLPGSTVRTFEAQGQLRHDENDVSPEREMALLAQNAGRFTTMSNLLRKEWGLLKAALNESVSEK